MAKKNHELTKKKSFDRVVIGQCRNNRLFSLESFFF